MGFLPDGAEQGWGSRGTGNPLTSVVRALPPHVRQAMLVASKKGLIARGTWDGCAFNAASKLGGENVGSVAEAARVFGCSQAVVNNFIGKWDKFTVGNPPRKPSDQEANRLLVEAINEVGTHTPIKGTKRVIRGYAYKSEATKFAEQLESGELTVEMIPGCKEVGELLSSCFS